MAKIDVYCTDEQKDVIQRRAINLGLSDSAFLLLCSNATIDIRVGVDPVVKNLESLKTMLDAGFITEKQCEKIRNEIIQGDSKPLISLKKHIGAIK